MKLIVGEPGSGKTKVMLALSQKNNVPILCESLARKERLLVKASGYGFFIPTPVVFDEDLKGISEVYVDDIQRLFECMFKADVTIASVNLVEPIEHC